MKFKNSQRVLLITGLLLMSMGGMVAQEHSGREHSERGGEHGGRETKLLRSSHERDYERKEGEESGQGFRKNETYNVTKKGVQLVLKFNAESNSFIGYMLNKTNKTIKKARVEIHLSNGVELGPTKPTNLKPAQKQRVKIKSTRKGFTTWSTHVEVGNSEHSHKKNEHK